MFLPEEALTKRAPCSTRATFLREKTGLEWRRAHIRILSTPCVFQITPVSRSDSKGRAEGAQNPPLNQAAGELQRDVQGGEEL